MIIQGDVRNKLKELEDESVHCVITSPPYWGLRDYGVEGQLGLEATPEEHIQEMVKIFREVRRVLKDDGSLWLNYGDTYASSVNGRSAADVKALTDDDRTFRDKPFNTAVEGLKPKDLVGMPWRLALALQADGWYLRSDIIWHKPNPMPESVRDRPTKSHEYLFLLTKSSQYYYDQEAIREHKTIESKPYFRVDRYLNNNSFNNNSLKDAPEDSRSKIEMGSRNKRTVWTIPTAPYKEAHFAVFPPKLVEPCLLAGCPEKVCSECGSPWGKVYNRKKSPYNDTRGDNQKFLKDGQKERLPVTEKKLSGQAMQKWLDNNPPILTGYQPTCQCNSTHQPGTVLDPFFGSGTVGQVAVKHNRHYIGIELNEEYVRLAKKRINKLTREDEVIDEYGNIQLTMFNDANSIH